MLDGFVIRGTTPTHDFDLPYPAELINDIRITYSQGGHSVFTKTKSSCKIEGQVATISLTQSETLLFTPRKTVDIQIRIQLFDKRVVQNEAPITLRVIDTADEEVFE